LENTISIAEIISLLKANWGTIVAVLGALGIGIEVTPFIKINPVSWLMRKIGSMLNAELLKEVSSLKKEFHDHLKEEDDEKINNIRKEIVDFSLSCQRGEHHTRDEFDRIFERVQKYHELLEKYDKENGKIDIEVNYIKKIYASCLEEHRFFEG
jgi:hypothetical protein